MSSQVLPRARTLKAACCLSESDKQASNFPSKVGVRSLAPMGVNWACRGCAGELEYGIQEEAGGRFNTGNLSSGQLVVVPQGGALLQSKLCQMVCRK